MATTPRLGMFHVKHVLNLVCRIFVRVNRVDKVVPQHSYGEDSGPVVDDVRIARSMLLQYLCNMPPLAIRPEPAYSDLLVVH